jgi:CRP-like cAMP-binding protein
MAMIDSSTGPSTVTAPTVTALTEVKLARLTPEKFSHLMSKNPEFCQHAMAVMAKRLRAVNDFISTHMKA